MVIELDPWYVVGLIDGEGGFYVGSNPSQVRLRLTIDNVDHDIIKAIRKFFGFGYITIKRQDGQKYLPCSQYRVSKYQDIEKLIAFLDEHPPIIKRISYLRFRDAFTQWRSAGGSRKGVRHQ